MPNENVDKVEDAEHRKDSEEMPVWAADMMSKLDATNKRLDAVESRKDADKDEGEDKTLTTEGKVKADSEDKPEVKADADKKDEAAAKEEHKAGEELAEARKREDAATARADASLARDNRELKGKLAAMEAQIGNLYREPSFEDRNALAEIRARADGVYQAVSGRTASEPLPGEAPIAYRKRMADGLRKFSAKFKAEKIDGLSGSAFDIVEGQIYADAAAAAKTPEIMPAGKLRAITRNDSGHTVTEYVGDANAAWAPFSAGAVMTVKMTKPAH